MTEISVGYVAQVPCLSLLHSADKARSGDEIALICLAYVFESRRLRCGYGGDAMDNELFEVRFCGSYVCYLYNQERPHYALERFTPEEVYAGVPTQLEAA